MGKAIKVSTTKRMKQVWDQTKKGTVQILKKEKCPLTNGRFNTSVRFSGKRKNSLV